MWIAKVVKIHKNVTSVALAHHITPIFGLFRCASISWFEVVSKSVSKWYFFGFPVNQVIPVFPVSQVIPVIPVSQVIPVIPVRQAIPVSPVSESSESSESNNL